jgi:ribosomal protein S18 acetylase RimI-like enzyme
VRPDSVLARQASAADAERIGDMLAVAYEPVMQRMPSSDAASFAGNLPGAVARYASRGVWLLAEQRAELVGAVAFFAPGSTTHPLYQGNVAHIQLLGVVPGWARKGVAQALMAECLSMTRTSGASELLLQTSELMPEARRLYERLGFILRNELPPVWGAPTYLLAKGDVQAFHVER